MNDSYDSILLVRNLRRRFGSNEVLCGVSLSMRRGQVVALLGPSGSGKTTLLRAVAGLDPPDSGRIELAGKAVFDAEQGIDIPAESRGLGLVFQSYALWPHRSVFDNVAYGLRLRRVPDAELCRRVSEILLRLGLADLAQRYPHQLSGGQQQRVALARALVYNPPLILLDEPLSNLDAKLREEARVWLRELISREHLSALYVTHDQVEAMAVADRILLLNAGQVEQEGAPERIYDNPATLFAAEFMGSNSRFPGRFAGVRGGNALLEGEGWRLEGILKSDKAAGTDATGLARIERLVLCQGEGANRIALKVADNLYLGGRWEHLLVAGPLQLRAYGPTSLAPGAQVWVEVAPNDFWIF